MTSDPLPSPSDPSPIRLFLRGQSVLGGNIFAALGLVTLTAGEATPGAYLFAGVLFLLVGLVFIEWSVTHPSPGGGFDFVRGELGDLAGFLAGSALALDLTVGIALFAVAGVSYANTFAPDLLGFDAVRQTVPFGADRLEWFWAIEAVAVVVALVLLNARSSRGRSGAREAVGLASFVLLTALVTSGLLLVWHPPSLRGVFSLPAGGASGTLYGLSLAILSFTSLQTFAASASEVSNPKATFVRPAIGLLLTTAFTAVALAFIASDPAGLGEFGRGEAPLAVLATRIAPAGHLLSGSVAVVAALVLLFAADALLASLSRMLYAMGEAGAIGTWSVWVHPRLQVPLANILVIALLVTAELALAFLLPGREPLQVLGNLYAFGACISYGFVTIALVKRRWCREAPARSQRVPLDLPLSISGGRRSLSLVGILALLGLASLLALVMATHEVGRLAGPAWMLLSLAAWIAFRLRQRASRAGIAR